MIDKLAAWLARTFAFLRERPKLAAALAVLILAAVVISPIPPVP